MGQYIATFHTHLAALQTSRALTAAGIAARMSPVPRKLSSSCGTCARYSAEDPQLEKMDADVEGVYLVEEGDFYRLIYQNK